MNVSIQRSIIDPAGFNPSPWFPPYELRTSCFQEAMQDVYDFFYDVNSMLLQRGLQRLDDMLRPVEIEDFRKNPRGELGTRTATLDADGIRKLREHWLYRKPAKV